MGHAKIAITLEESFLKQLDELVAQKKFVNRSKAIQEAVKEKIESMNQTRLARECEKLDPTQERMIAEEGMEYEVGEWPEY